MPYISWPLRFVLPAHADMRFERDTPTSRLLSRVMPWMKGRRPAWLIRLGLLMYDRMLGSCCSSHDDGVAAGLRPGWRTPIYALNGSEGDR